MVDEAIPVASRYKNFAKVNYPLRFLLTAQGTPKSRAWKLSRACDTLRLSSLFIDSGAFIIRSAYYKHGKLPGLFEIEDILRAHLGACRWLIEHEYPVCAVAEMDLADFYGLDTVKYWREKYMFPFQEDLGVPVVLNPSGESIDKLIVDKRVRYLGMSAVLSPKVMKAMTGSTDEYYKYLKLIAVLCFQNGVKFHGYGVARTSVLKKVPFYSVDSATWQAALHFGRIMMFDPGSGDLLNAYVSRSHYKKRGKNFIVENVLKSQRYGSTLCLSDVMGKKLLTKKGLKQKPNVLRIFRSQTEIWYDMEKYFTRYWALKGLDWGIFDALDDKRSR